VKAATLDVSDLPEGRLDARSTIWWGTVGMMVMETTAFALVVGSYFYLRVIANTWPPGDTAPPDLLLPTIGLGVLIVSLVSAVWADRAGKNLDTRGVRAALVLNLIFGVAFLVFRLLGFYSLNCLWNRNAYCSAVWTLLSLHTTHVVAQLLETATVAVLFFVKKPEKKHFLDARLAGVYWYFVVGAWLPLYAVIYLVPRM
jgi:heme/copper-type cytochrome/quinol oxidase subunit 3